MTAKLYFTIDGLIHRIEFHDLLGHTLSTIGEVPLVSCEKLEIITVDVRDLENLILLLNNL
jgi:hypothetical protein